MKLILSFLLPSFVLTASDLHAQVAITNLHSFSVSAHGANPESALVQGNDGNYYGTTYNGGASGGKGTVFRVTAKGVVLQNTGVGGGFFLDSSFGAVTLQP